MLRHDAALQRRIDEVDEALARRIAEQADADAPAGPTSQEPADSGEE